MTRRRWIADEVSGDRAALTGEHADHLIRVLRVRAGEEFDIAAGALVRRGRVVEISAGRVEFELAEEVSVAAAAEAPSKVTLLLAVFKFDRMEWAIEKCTELGVAQILPVICQRTDAHLAAASVKRTERWRRIALQASEQSRRATPPEISDPLKFADAVRLSDALRIALLESEKQFRMRDVLPTQSPSEVMLAVGPEGGWTENEVQLFHAAGWISASLGKTILRAETAAIAATAIVLSELE
ncbi:MAG TPA: RsmE family RNA methyltransferase [Candidatus Sulfotelmatobacter sp.]|jgi:16S rRNA (uracil1498-N3)-methyltransferase